MSGKLTWAFRSLGCRWRRHVDEAPNVCVELVVHDLHRRVLDHAPERFLLRHLPHAACPRMEIVGRELAMLVRVPRDLEQRKLHEVEEILLNLPFRVQVLDVVLVDGRESRVLDTDLAELVLQLHQLGEVRDELRFSRLAELDRREDEPTGDGERRQRLERNLENLEIGRHAESYTRFRPSLSAMSMLR